MDTEFWITKLDLVRIYQSKTTQTWLNRWYDCIFKALLELSQPTSNSINATKEYHENVAYHSIIRSSSR